MVLKIMIVYIYKPESRYSQEYRLSGGASTTIIFRGLLPYTGRHPGHGVRLTSETESYYFFSSAFFSALVSGLPSPL